MNKDTDIALPRPPYRRPGLRGALRHGWQWPLYRLQCLRGEMKTPFERLMAALDAYLLDHNIVRLFFPNQHEVAPGVKRSAQPLPHHIKQAGAHGLKTILNLRGATGNAAYARERLACKAAGITLVDLTLPSRGAPTVEQIHALHAAFSHHRPLLIHCKSGADRAGFASAVYLLTHGGRAADAARQLSWRYGHVKGAKTGILDAVIAAYARDHAETGIAFMDWVDTRYDPAAITAAFRETRGAAFLVDRVLGRE